MASCRTIPLDSLPPFILEEICVYLAISRDPREDSAKLREGLGAISSTSRRCYWAAAKARFRRIRVVFTSLANFEDDLKALDKVLTEGGHFHHVRQLILMFSDNGDDDTDDGGFSDLHPQLQPARITLSRHWIVTTLAADAQEMWRTLSGLISRMHALQHFVFALPHHLDPSILTAVHAVGCRLHMHCFSVPSLYQSKHQPGEISPSDYALITSPSLYSIVVSTAPYDLRGQVDYHEEALLRMVAGTAPGLAHVWLRDRPLAGTIALQRAMHSPRPPWQGFFPSEEREHEASVTGCLRSLALQHHLVRRQDLITWSHATNFSKLSCLVLSLNWYDSKSYSKCCESLDELLEMAKTGQFASLKSLSLEHCGDPKQGNNGEFLASLMMFLNTIEPLRRLHISHAGTMRTDTLSAAISRHTLSSCCQLFSQTSAN